MIKGNNNIKDNDHLFYQLRIFMNIILQSLRKTIKCIGTFTLRNCDMQAAISRLSVT